MKTNAFNRLMASLNLGNKVTANSHGVRDLARRIFPNAVFDPEDLYYTDGPEPTMWVLPQAPYTLQQLVYFMRALDRNTTKYRVNYIMPDDSKGKLAIRVVFFKNFTPTR